MATTLTCESCGASLEIENQFVRAVTCRFCGSSYIVQGDASLDMTGKTVSLANYPSRLSIGSTGKIKGQTFRVLGRVRYTYGEGFWDEWLVTMSDDKPPVWLEEDEGYWTIYRKGRLKSAVPAYDEVSVGQTADINGKPLFVTEKRRANLMGTEGQFSSVMPLSGEFGYIQGAMEGQPASVTYWDDEIELSLGEELDHDDIELT